MKKVAILTNFNCYDPSYSLNIVASNQVRMLLASGYEPVFIGMKGFEAKGAYADPRVTIEISPPATASNDGILPENWKDEVETLRKFYADCLERHEIDVVITHDLIAQAAALVSNLACREVAKANKEIMWIHAIHSCFSSNMPSNVWEASEEGRRRWPTKFKIVFPNAYDIPRVARSFNVEETDVAVIPHPTDIAGFLGFSPELVKLEDETRFLDKEVLMVMPARLDRGKQVDCNVDLAIALKRAGATVGLIVADFHSTGGDKVTFREELKAQGAKGGLNENDLIFLSERVPEFRHSAPQSAIRQLMSASNVFMLASKSETYSFVAQEAGLLGNLMILNHDFYPMRSIYGDEPKYFRFSAAIGEDGISNDHRTVNYGSRDAYFDDIARYVLYMVRHDRTLRMRTKLRVGRGLRAVCKNFFEPLLYAD